MDQLSLFSSFNHQAAAQLREAAAQYIDLGLLASLAAERGNIWEAIRSGDIPAELENALRLLQALLTPPATTQITSPADLAAMLMIEMGALTQEHLRVVCLNTKNHVLKISTVTIGSINSASVRTAEVFRDALKLNAAAIILIHNHPSGDPTPSADDVIVTRSLVEAGKLLDVELLDHLVIGQGHWVSMRERRLGW